MSCKELHSLPVIECGKVEFVKTPIEYFFNPVTKIVTDNVGNQIGVGEMIGNTLKVTSKKIFFNVVRNSRIRSNPSESN